MSAPWTVAVATLESAIAARLEAEERGDEQAIADAEIRIIEGHQTLIRLGVVSSLARMS